MNRSGRGGGRRYTETRLGPVSRFKGVKVMYILAQSKGLAIGNSRFTQGTCARPPGRPGRPVAAAKKSGRPHHRLEACATNRPSARRQQPEYLANSEGGDVSGGSRGIPGLPASPGGGPG